jgi:large subunit ribosomal protein L4
MLRLNTLRISSPLTCSFQKPFPSNVIIRQQQNPDRYFKGVRCAASLLERIHPRLRKKLKKEKNKSVSPIEAIFGSVSYKDLIRKSPLEKRKEKPKSPEEAEQEKKRKSKILDLRTLPPEEVDRILEERIKIFAEQQQEMLKVREKLAPKPPPTFEMPVLDCHGKVVGSVWLPKHIFGVPVRKDILHRVVRWQLAKRRRGTAKAKTRAEVRGSGRKLWPQKGTGRARVGDNRSPTRRGGGVVFPPRPRSFAFKLPKKVRLLGLKCALSAKFAQGKLVIMDTFDLLPYDPQNVPKTDEEKKTNPPKTKRVFKKLRALGFQSVLMVDAKPTLDPYVLRATLNIPWVDFISSKQINVYDILRRDTLILHKDLIPVLEKRLPDM